MKTLRNLKQAASMAVIALLFGSGCTSPPNTAIQQSRLPLSYIIPSTVDTFNVGRIHNLLLYYIFTHYDTVKYASYPNKFSQTGIDSLATLFITDSIQTPTGSFTSGEISSVVAAFDSSFTACSLAAGGPTHAQLVASVGTLESQGFLASDEGNFIVKADTDIRLCFSYSQILDTTSSLLTQYNSITWSPSTSHGVVAYDYLSVADHSARFWGQSGDTLPIHPPISADAAALIKAEAYANWMVQNGYWTEDQANLYISVVGAGASGGSSTYGGLTGRQWEQVGITTLGVFAIILIIASFL